MIADALEATRRVKGAHRLCAIHQPNFFPWQGYFDKIRRADVFIFLDSVAYPRSGSGMGSWVNRVKICSQGSPVWFGCPISRYSGTKKILDVSFANDSWKGKILKTLEANYGRHRNFNRSIELLEPIFQFETSSLADFNINAIKKISGHLGLDVEFVRQSELDVTGASTDLLCNLTVAVHADAYLCGGGAAEYQDDALFEKAGLELVYQNFKEASYSEPFLPGLSIIDFLMAHEPNRLFNS